MKSQKRPKIFPQKQPDLSIVIPAYCEEKRIGLTLDALAVFLKDDDFFSRKEVEVLVVAADAPDRTHAIVEAKRKLFKSNRFILLKPGPAVGKGRDVQYGMLRASGKIIVFMDADLATPLHHLHEFYRACESDNDIVIGTRNMLTYRSSNIRGLFSGFGNLLYRLAGGVKVEDTQCGFKMFSERACGLCFSRLTVLGWGFDLDVLAIAQVNKLSVQSFRLDDWQQMPYSTYTDGIPKIALNMAKDFGRIAKNRIMGVYIEH